MQQYTLTKESIAMLPGRYLNVREYSDGEVNFFSIHHRSGTSEEIALSRYVDASDIRYEPDQGWIMADGQEIPYL